MADATKRRIDAFYNTRSRHSTLDYVSPAEYERRFWSARNEQCVMVEIAAIAPIRKPRRMHQERF
jgi:hypothetical protein